MKLSESVEIEREIGLKKATAYVALQRLRQIRCAWEGREAFGVRCVPSLCRRLKFYRTTTWLKIIKDIHLVGLKTVDGLDLCWRSNTTCILLQPPPSHA